MRECTFSSSESLVQSELAHQLVVQRRVVLGAQLLPRLCDASRRGQRSGWQSNGASDQRTRHKVDVSDIRRILGEDDGQASNEMEVDVTVEEPRPGVVGLQRQRFVSSYDRQTGEDAERTYHEADRDVVSRKADVDRVPPEGLHVGVLGGACSAEFVRSYDRQTDRQRQARSIG